MLAAGQRFYTLKNQKARGSIVAKESRCNPERRCTALAAAWKTLAQSFATSLAARCNALILRAATSVNIKGDGVYRGAQQTANNKTRANLETHRRGAKKRKSEAMLRHILVPVDGLYQITLASIGGAGGWRHKSPKWPSSAGGHMQRCISQLADGKTAVNIGALAAALLGTISAQSAGLAKDRAALALAISSSRRRSALQ